MEATHNQSHQHQNGDPEELNNALFTCPMHPQIIQEEPGKCPICGMTLVPKGNQPDHSKMVITEHEKVIWNYYTVIVLGFWLLTSPFTFGYKSPGMVYSDLFSGVLLIFLGFLSFNPFRLWAPWVACFVGIWLLFAPLVFWAPEAAAFVNGSFVGILVIALTILIPGMPGMMAMMMVMPPGPETPPGWSYNPSSWLQRIPVIALGWIGFFGSRYLAAYQLGYIPEVYDPFFASGTQEVLTSDVSKAFPISDAGLGAVVYVLEFLMGYMGGSDRWRTMPWMVTLFGILVVPLGVVSIVLIILQPVAVGAWCTICLVTALAMLIMIPLTIDEVVAMVQFLVKKHREGSPFWPTFWMGDTVAGGGPDKRSPGFTAPVTKTLPAMTWGVTIPWNLVAATAIGIWLMFSGAVFSSQGSFAASTNIAGALVVTFTVISLAEVTRSLRFINFLFGLWLLVSPWILEGAASGAEWNSLLAGVGIILLSFPKGQIRESYGTYDSSII